MPTLLRNVLAVIVGILVGGLLNSAIVTLGPALIPPPAGVDVNNVESLAKSMHLFQPQHFVMPFLAHALGTLAGAFVAYLIAASFKQRFAFAIGAFFLCGGIAAGFLIPAPAWFIALDVLVAYLPMAWLASRLGRRLQLGNGG